MTTRRASADRNSPLDHALDAFVRELDALRPQAAHARGDARAAIVSRLASLDAELQTIARTHASDAVRTAAAREARTDLEPFRERMSAEAFAAAVQSATDRQLRDAAGLPHARYWRSERGMPPRELTLTIEKPAAGGRMIARREGQVVLVAGAIPGERVRADVEQVRGGVMYARVSEVIDASPDRRPQICDPACGGSAYAHVSYERQCRLKSDIVQDAFTRIARHHLQQSVPVTPSPEDGYRMRARLHVRGSRIGFFREEPRPLRSGADPPTVATDLVDPGRPGGPMAAHAACLPRDRSERNIDASQRALLIDVAEDCTAAEASALIAGIHEVDVTGAVVARAGARVLASEGSPYVADTIAVDRNAARVTLRRHVAGFFQGNRFVLQPLIDAVLAQLPRGRLIDLYAGVGVFGLAWAALDRGTVTTVEGDRQSSLDLAANAEPYGAAVLVASTSIERYVSGSFDARDATILLDPPRTGMSKEAAAAIVQARAPRVVYVSCDVATLARDTRRFLDEGYNIAHVEAFDLFPNTAHVETLVTFAWPSSSPKN